MYIFIVAEILCSVLDQFVEILGNEILDIDTFVHLFRQVLTQYSVGSIPASLDQVAVSGITRNDRHTVKYLFLLGANDHVLPATGQGTGILNESDREELSQLGIELAPSGLDQMEMELQNLYAALAQPTEEITISYPLYGTDGAELRPAFVIPRLITLFPSLQVEKENVMQKTYRLTAKIPALEAAGTAIGGKVWQYFMQDGNYTKELAAMKNAAMLRRGSLSRHAVYALYGKRVAMSASRLERMRLCHFAYFMEYGLKAKPRKRAVFDASQIGVFLHYLLEQVTRDVINMGGFVKTDDEILKGLTEKYTERYINEEFGERKNARFQYLFTRLRDTAVAIVQQVAEEMRHSDFVPLECELSFGDGKNNDLPAVVISKGETQLRVGGKVDRVDGWIKDDKLYLRVIDYKSGRKSFELGAVTMGLDIQMLLYLFTIQEKGKKRFKRKEDIQPAGVLYLPARDDIFMAERNTSEDEIKTLRRKRLKRSGIVLGEPEVLEAMEREALTAPQYLPLKKARDGSLSGVASAEQLGKLGQYVKQILQEIAEEIQAGNIDADPCCHNEDDSPCKYCDWSAACHFEDGRDGDHLRYILSLKNQDFWNVILNATSKKTDTKNIT